MEALDKDSCRDLKTDMRTNANGNGKAAWLILERECAETVSSLDDGNKIREWWALTMEKDVGVNPDSIVTMNRLITAKNALLTTSFSGDECTEKFLQSVKRPGYPGLPRGPPGPLSRASGSPTGSPGGAHRHRER